VPKEQIGCLRGTKECKDQILKSKATLQEYKGRKKRLCMAWIDYQKAVDNVLHSWIIKSFQLFEINNKIKIFTKKTMSYWKTSTCLRTNGKIIENEDLEIKHGIFQKDSLSPLL